MPHGRNLGVSSSAKPLPVVGEGIDAAHALADPEGGGDENKGILNVPLDSMQQVSSVLSGLYEES